MIQSILCVILLAVYFAGFVLYPKHREGRNGFSLLLVGGMVLIFVTGAGAALFTFVKIPVNLATNNLCIFIADILVWIPAIRQRQIAKPVWPVWDAVSLLIILGFAGAMCVIKFGFSLDLTYGDVDPARYMKMAMDIVREQKVSGEFLTSFINAMFILLCKPFLLPVSYYRALVLSDILIHLFSIAMFYILLAKFNHGRGKWANPLICVLYFCGYQLHNLSYGAFFHWVDGILIIMYLIYIIFLLEKEEISQLEGICGSILGVFGLLVCYPFFAPIAAVMFLPEFVIWCWKHLPKLDKKHWTVLAAGGTVFAVAGIFFASQRIGHSIEKLLLDLRTEGLAYREPYMDFLFFVPIVICLMGMMFKNKKESRILVRMNTAALLFMCFWFLLMSWGHLSMYYFYRMYYVLWLLVWLMVGQLLHIMVQERRVAGLVSYSVFYGIVILISVTGLNDRLYQLNKKLFDDHQHYRSLAPLYTMNYETMVSEHREILTGPELSIYDSVIENFQDEIVPIVHSVYSAMQADWYLGITGVHTYNGRYDLSENSIRDVFKRFEKRNISYFTILKGDLFYQNYKNEIFDKLEIVEENRDGVIYTCKDHEWLKVIGSTDELTSAEKKLYREVENNYRGTEPLLLCEPELGQKAKYYAIYTGVEVYDYWEEYNPENMLEKTYRLNMDEVEFVVVLKDSQMYRMNQDYFDSQVRVFENEAGMVLKHSGTGWMPSEQE